MIINFITQLQGPVCLVAHNGTRCDFPILKKQILNCDKEIPRDILVIDSLDVFRELDKWEEEENSTIFNDKKSSESEESESGIDIQKLNETTPKRIKPIPTNPFRTSIKSEELTTPQKSISNRKRSIPSSRRSLFPSANSAVSTPKKSFTLINIHQRMFGEVPPISHFAEADTISLIKCAAEKKEKFVEFCEANAKLFCDVKPLSPIW